MKTKEWAAYIALSLIWGSSFLWIKIALQEMEPLTLVAYRLLIGLLGLLVVVVVQRPPRPQERRLWLAMMVLGLTNTALPFILISWGQQFIDSGVAAILNSTLPLFTLVVAHYFLEDERINLRSSFGLGLGFFGVVLLVSRDLTRGEMPYSLAGQLAVLLAAFFYAGSNVFTRKNLRGVSPIFQAFLTVLVADALVWLLVPLVESPLQVPSSALTWLALIWLGLLGSCTAYLLYYYLIQTVGSTRTATVAYIFPVVGVLLGVIFLNEELNWELAAGTGLVVAGVWVVNSRRRFSWRGAKAVVPD